VAIRIYSGEAPIIRWPAWRGCSRPSAACRLREAIGDSKAARSTNSTMRPTARGT